jgi:hypothetical protein
MPGTCCLIKAIKLAERLPFELESPLGRSGFAAGLGSIGLRKARAAANRSSKRLFASASR